MSHPGQSNITAGGITGVAALLMMTAGPRITPDAYWYAGALGVATAALLAVGSRQASRPHGSDGDTARSVDPPQPRL